MVYENKTSHVGIGDLRIEIGYVDLKYLSCTIGELSTLVA